MIQMPMALSSTMLAIDESRALTAVSRSLPEKAAPAEITNVMTEIQALIGVLILMPRILYANRTLMLSRLLIRAMTSI